MNELNEKMNINYSKKLNKDELTYFLFNFEELTQPVAEREYKEGINNPFQYPYNYETRELCYLKRHKFLRNNRGIQKKIFAGNSKHNVADILIGRFFNDAKKDSKLIITQQSFCNYIGVNSDTFKSEFIKTDGGKTWIELYHEWLWSMYLKPDLYLATGSRYAVPSLFKHDSNINIVVDNNQPEEEPILNDNNEIIL